MQRRPYTISIAGWGLVIYGFYGFGMMLWAILVLGGPECAAILAKANPQARQIATDFLWVVLGAYIVMSLFDVWIGMFVLAGSNWSRWLYAVMGFLLFLIEWKTGYPAFVRDTIITVLVVVLVFVPASNRFFVAHEH